VIRLSEILGKEVVTESGWSLGSVFDVRVDIRGTEPTVSGLVVAAPGLRRRLIGESHRRNPRVLAEGAVPWKAVQEVGNVIRVAEVPSPQEQIEEGQ
jgi:sporulation protein YlmC with PRC-barrel domain